MSNNIPISSLHIDDLNFSNDEEEEDSLIIEEEEDSLIIEEEEVDDYEKTFTPKGERGDHHETNKGVGGIFMTKLETEKQEKKKKSMLTRMETTGLSKRDKFLNDVMNYECA